MTYFATIFRLLVSVVFIYASIDKILKPESFAKQVLAYEILPTFFVYPFSFTLPALELITGIAIWFKSCRMGANLMATAMTILFIFALSFALVTGKDINCGCFAHESKVDIYKILIDGILLILIMLLIRTDWMKESKQTDLLSK